MFTTKEKIALGIGVLVCVGEIVFRLAVKKMSEEKMMQHFGVRTADEFLAKRRKDLDEMRCTRGKMGS